jgi:hypothetical protein
MNPTVKAFAISFSMVAFISGAAAAAATGSHHKFCVPQGTKLSSACRSHGYANGATAHFKADARAEKRAREAHNPKKE